MAQVWSKAKSLAKAWKAARLALTGGVAGGTVGVALVEWFTSMGWDFWPNALDAPVAATLTALGALLVAAWRIYVADKEKHGGNAA